MQFLRKDKLVSELMDVVSKKYDTVMFKYCYYLFNDMKLGKGNRWICTYKSDIDEFFSDLSKMKKEVIKNLRDYLKWDDFIAYIDIPIDGVEVKEHEIFTKYFVIEINVTKILSYNNKKLKDFIEVFDFDNVII